MKKTEAKRRAIIERLADHLLAEGFGQSSLRQLAKAASMSDRMLLHYFATKDELLTAVLLQITDRLKAILDQAKLEPMPFEALVHYLAGMIKDPTIRPYLRLWLELAASAAGGDEGYRTMAHKILENFFDWLLAAIRVEQESMRLPQASLALAMVEGFVVMDMVDTGDLITSALSALKQSPI